MRFAIISDIHANQQAWDAVLKDIKQYAVDEILCLGDVVGYGPRPVDVLEDVYSYCDNFVLGNHDAVVGDRMDSSLFNDNAKYLIDWTKSQLNDGAASFFREMPMVIEADSFMVTHADAADPEGFAYLHQAADAQPSFDVMSVNMLFVGHTHHPCTMVLDQSSGEITHAMPADFTARPDHKYIINPGSVGDPRDGDCRASYCIFDDESQSIFFRRVPFDIAAYKRDLAAQQLPVKPHFVMISEGLEQGDSDLNDMKKRRAPSFRTTRPKTVKLSIDAVNAHTAKTRKLSAAGSSGQPAKRKPPRRKVAKRKAARPEPATASRSRGGLITIVLSIVAVLLMIVAAIVLSRPPKSTAAAQVSNAPAVQAPATQHAVASGPVRQPTVRDSGQTQTLKNTAPAQVQQQASAPVPPVTLRPAPQSTGPFVPDPSKVYHIDCVAGGRLSGKGPTGNAYGETYVMPHGVDDSETGDHVRWQFVANGDRWHIDMRAGASSPRLWAAKVLHGVVMTDTSKGGGWTQFTVTDAGDGKVYITAPEGPLGKRLGFFGDTIKMGQPSATGASFEFVITEAGRD